MAGGEVDGISPVAQDYLKVIWAATEWGDPPITTSALAARFGTSASNVSDTLRRLAGQGLVHYQPYRPVELTRAGERLAIAMVRRHRLIETFLARVVGYGWDEVHDEAERLEHAVSERFLERIDDLLGHPSHDPHGDPIPGVDSGPSLGGQRLAGVQGGICRVVRVSDADPEVLARLHSSGIRPGVEIDVAVVELSATDRAAVWVVPLD